MKAIHSKLSKSRTKMRFVFSQKQHFFFIPILVLFLISHFGNIATAQSFGFRLKNEKDVIEIPFEVHNGFLVVTVHLNKSFPLYFIFDTGAEHTILCKPIYAQILGIQPSRSIRLIGADLNEHLVAHVATNTRIQVGNAIAPNQDILILSDDYFKLDEYVGREIQGIIGADLFRNYVLKIDYSKNKITIQRSNFFKPPKRKWKKIPISIEKSKPYLSAQIYQNDTIINVKLLLDTGASLSLLLHTNTNKNLKLPENFVRGSLGRGLGGILEGFLGRLHSLRFGGFYFNNIITNYQDVLETIDPKSISLRNGIIGNSLISRFNLIIDYPKENLYLQAHWRYNKGFKYDRSGLELIVSGEKLETITVYNLIENSPAKNAGFQKGDLIKSVNYIPASVLKLSGVNQKLQKRVGKKIRIKIKRNGKTMILKFRLKDLI